VSNLYIPARITDRVWAEKFVEGQIFMRSLTELGAWEAVQRYTKDELNNSFRGDLREGTVKVVANPVIIAIAFNMTLSEFLDFDELNEFSFDDDVEEIE